MKQALRSILLVGVLITIISTTFALDSTLTFKVGTALSKTDINIEETNHLMGGLSFEVWLKDYLSLGLSPYFATLEEESTAYQYKTKLIGGDLQMRFRPTQKIAYRSETGFFSHIGPFVNAGVGLVNHDVDSNITTVNPGADYSDGGLGVTIPNVGAGISFVTQWGLGLDLGFQYEWSPLKYHLDYLDGYQQKNYNDDYVMPYVGLAFNFMKPKDRDGDGIIDRKDKDPDNAEDFDEFEDWDGAPDYDNDQDGVLDVNDGAPNDPEDMDGYMDSDGIPDPDNDGDGILDVNDGAPNQAEDMDGFEDKDGIPDPDNDKDGILDANDKAPNAPEDKDGFEDMDGVPDPDNDKDGVLDVNDKAPGTDMTLKDGIETKETMNGYMDEDGVPDVKPGETKPVEKPIEKPKPEVTPKPEVNINEYNIENVLFDTNYATIKSIYYPTMDMIYTLLNDNQNWKLEVNGHTDNTGGAELNQRLSLRRAQAAKDYLVRKGIAASRITVKGFGFDQPTASNDTPEGRTLNRRVDFKITK